MNVRHKEKLTQKGKKVIPLYISEETWEDLKLLAAKKHTNMNELCREGIEYIIKKYK